MKTVEAIIDASGAVHLSEAIVVDAPRRALVTVLDESPDRIEPAVLSAAALAVDWNRPEEDAAWAHLQPGK